MNVAVIGTGYVGLVLGACLAETGNTVTAADIDEEKIEGLRRNVLPIYEPGLDSLVERNQAAGRLRFTTDVAGAIAASRVVFIAVGTPPDEDGSADLRHVLAVAEEIGAHMGGETVVVTKSTVPVGTAEAVRSVIARRARFPFHMCSNPEFLKEGAAVNDFMRPDRVVVGVDSKEAADVITDLYAPFVRTGKPVILMDIPSAEVTKYAANAMLATRISFMNEMAGLCERVGADVDAVRRGIGSDPRIGPQFLFPGPGFGGSCFPKDLRALKLIAEEYSLSMEVVAAAERANERQKHVLFGKLKRALGSISGRRVAVWGMSFKPETDDMRESPSLPLIDAVLAAGGSISAHDPVAAAEARRRFGDRITLAGSSYDALAGAAALVVVTEWNEYRRPDFDRIKATLSEPIIVDGRNLYDPARMAAMGFKYLSIGRPQA